MKKIKAKKMRIKKYKLKKGEVAYATKPGGKCFKVTKGAITVSADEKLFVGNPAEIDDDIASKQLKIEDKHIKSRSKSNTKKPNIK